MAKERPRMDGRVKAVIDLMEESMSRQLSIPTLARNVNLSSTRLRQLFRKETGGSPVEYLTKLRVKRAAQLLRSTFLSIKEISSLCGVRDGGYFVRELKKQYGLTPSAFRARKGVSLRVSLRNDKSVE